MSVAFSEDGRTLAAGSYDGSVQVWEAATQRPLGRRCTGASRGQQRRVQPRRPHARRGRLRRPCAAMGHRPRRQLAARSLARRDVYGMSRSAPTGARWPAAAATGRSACGVVRFPTAAGDRRSARATSVHERRVQPRRADARPAGGAARCSCGIVLRSVSRRSPMRTGARGRRRRVQPRGKHPRRGRPRTARCCCAIADSASATARAAARQRQRDPERRVQSRRAHARRRKLRRHGPAVGPRRPRAAGLSRWRPAPTSSTASRSVPMGAHSPRPASDGAVRLWDAAARMPRRLAADDRGRDRLQRRVQP